MESREVNSEVGGVLLDAYPEMKVDVHDPQVMLNIEIREKIYVYSIEIPGPGECRWGPTARECSFCPAESIRPVAGWMIAKRGVKIDAVYFHAPPYTSDRAKQKVVDLARKVARCSGPDLAACDQFYRYPALHLRKVPA